MQPTHLPITADVTEDDLRAMPAGKLEQMRNSAWNLVDAYGEAASKSKQRPTALAYGMEKDRAKQIALKIEAEAERRKSEG